MADVLSLSDPPGEALPGTSHDAARVRLPPWRPWEIRNRYLEGTNVVVLDPDIAEAFPNAGAVNRALRALLTVVPTGGFDGAAAPSPIFERAAS